MKTTNNWCLDIESLDIERRRLQKKLDGWYEKELSELVKFNKYLKEENMKIAQDPVNMNLTDCIIKINNDPDFKEIEKEERTHEKSQKH